MLSKETENFTTDPPSKNYSDFFSPHTSTSILSSITPGTTNEIAVDRAICVTPYPPLAPSHPHNYEPDMYEE